MMTDKKRIEIEIEISLVEDDIKWAVNYIKSHGKNDYIKFFLETKIREITSLLQLKYALDESEAISK
jgi:hypothetical protein